MLHLWMICLFAVLFVGEALDAPLAAMLFGEDVWRERVSGWWVVGGHLAAMAALGALVTLLILRDGRLLDKTGRHRYIRRAHLIADLGQGAAVLLHVVSVVVFGWLHAIRAGFESVLGFGNPVLIDELLAIAPALAVFVAGWWALYGIDRRCREAALMGALDAGRAPGAISMPTRRQFVISHIRHQMLMTLAPMALIIGWAECADWLIAVAERGGIPGAVGESIAAALASGATVEWVRAALHFSGVAVILVSAPLLLRLIWETVPMPAGPLRERLEQICAGAKVRVRNILIWRTHGSMINGAVVGLLPWLRYILLTDALLDSLTRPQVEAVMAHEVAHARHRHMPWLAAVLLTAIAAAGLVVSLLIELLAMIPWVERLLESAASKGGDASAAVQVGIEASLGALSLIAGLLVFGWASRRFEWQADAFAVQCLSRVHAEAAPPPDSTTSDPALAAAPPSAPPGPPAMSPAAVGAMAGALGAVAAMNGIPRRKRSWRHGSIATRQARLRALAGVPIVATPIDRTVRRIKAAAAAGMLVVVALLVWLG